MSAKDQNEAIPIFNLKRSEYNRGIGLFRLRTWRKQKLKKYSVAQTKNVREKFEGI